MYIHREGYKICIITAVIALAIIAYIVNYMEVWNGFAWAGIGITAITSWIIIRFFRIPKREMIHNESQIIAAADGKIVVVEQTFESEVLNSECIQISTFMSPSNVHVNRYPVSGKVVYANYHAGRYFIAKHPKSSTLNERTTVCVETLEGKRIVIRQIAGALARRIVCYAHEGQMVKQGDELGFIKFGSRVDLFIPLDCDVHVELEDKVRGSLSVLATLPLATQQ
ncbi:MAG: phosphatidylserine decarboxylase family protein [Bacteroidales bacterium]|jgi:phosphatidylserine decarboxylase|nr:phosphatidylserine decarboxylase family protein [Bacteroidales bacterium]